jgi:hypothetical protein
MLRQLLIGACLLLAAIAFLPASEGAHACVNPGGTQCVRVLENGCYVSTDIVLPTTGTGCGTTPPFSGGGICWAEVGGAQYLCWFVFPGAECVGVAYRLTPTSNWNCIGV